MFYHPGVALTTVTVHGEILDPNGITPAVGTVQFKILHELRDVVDNITYSPTTFTATLDVNGEFTIVLPATDNPDILPLNWVYQVWVNTDVWQELFYVQLPFAPGVTEFADLEHLDFDPCEGLPLAEPIPGSDLDLFVRKAGDTMTGNLIINANLTVNGEAVVDYNTGFTDVNIGRALSTVMSTGVVSGGAITINANPALINIGPTTGWIVDYNASGVIGATNPTITFVNFPGQTGVALTGPPTQSATWWLLDSAGTLIQQALTPSATQFRTHLVLGASAQAAGVNFLVQDLPTIQSQPAAQFVDLAHALGPFSPTSVDNVIVANGANLMINTSGGRLFSRAFALPAYLDPNFATLSAQTPASFRYATAVSVGAAVVNTIDVANYDPGGLGVITPIGGGAFTTTIHRVYVFGSPTVPEQMAIQYGQNTYASLPAAVAAIGSGNFVENPLFINGTLAGYIAAVRTAVDLSITTQASFTHAGKFSHP